MAGAYFKEKMLLYLCGKERMDRTQIAVGKAEEMDELDRKYWSAASIKEKLETITYLRECFYGKEATTGRLQRVYTVFKQE